MVKLLEMPALIRSSMTGNFMPHGNVEDTEWLAGFSFGLVCDSNGNYSEPGTTNEALGKWIIDVYRCHPIPLVLQQELADVVRTGERKARGDIEQFATMKSPRQTHTTHELIQQMQERGFTTNNFGTVAIAAFRYHLPRVDAQLQTAGYTTVADASLKTVGDFDLLSSQPWTRHEDSWRKREPLVIAHHVFTGKI